MSISDERLAELIGLGCDGIARHEACDLATEIQGFRAAAKVRAIRGGDGEFKLGDRVTKAKGASWTGRVVGFYSTTLTPVGYAVESENEPGSVQIYPEAALAASPFPTGGEKE